MPTLSPHHKGLEKVYEKLLVREQWESTGASETRWANQIPVFSGITRGKDRGVSIDLGYKESDTVFRWYELKTGDANDSLYGLIELLTYALGYLIIRRIVNLVPTAEHLIRQRSKGLLDANETKWILVGTPNFYLRKLRGGRRLSAAEVDRIRVATEQAMSVAAKRLGFSSIKMTVEARQLSRDLPRIAPGQQEEWLEEIKAGTTLREAVLRAKQLLTS